LGAAEKTALLFLLCGLYNILNSNDRNQDPRQFSKTYPQLELSSVDLEGFRLQGIKKELQAGQTLLGVQAQCELLPFVLDGGLRVYQSAASGREIILYHIHPGNSCILSALGILADRGFPAYAKADSATTLILMPGALLKRFVNHYPLGVTLFSAYILTALTS
jgi:CRP-like cAMP-binding protein